MKGYHALDKYIFKNFKIDVEKLQNLNTKIMEIDLNDYYEYIKIENDEIFLKKNIPNNIKRLYIFHASNSDYDNDDLYINVMEKLNLNNLPNIKVLHTFTTNLNFLPSSLEYLLIDNVYLEIGNEINDCFLNLPMSLKYLIINDVYGYTSKIIIDNFLKKMKTIYRNLNIILPNYTVSKKITNLLFDSIF